MQLPLRVGIDMPLKNIAHAIGGAIEGDDSITIRGVCLDTRAIQEGDLFFAIKSTRDGHDFVQEALNKGAIAAVIQKAVNASGTFLRVEDTLKALAVFGNHERRKWGKKIVAVCGSNGKTTTKEMTAAILASTKKVHKTPGNWNNALGVPLTLLLLKPEHDFAVMEMGINDFGEMKALTEICEPDVGLLTNIGPEHLEKFGSIDGVAKAEGELFETLKSTGVAIVNLDDPKIKVLAEKINLRKATFSLKADADVTARVVRDAGPMGLVLAVKYGSEEIEIRTSFLGIHNVYNLLAGLTAAWVFKIPSANLQAGVDAIQRPDMRLEIVEVPKGIRIVNDCYNANPASMLAALEVVREMAPGRMMAVLGDMLELGDFSARAHRDIGIKVATSKFAYLFVMGRFSGDYIQGAIQGGMPRENIQNFQNHEALSGKLFEILKPQDTVLVKGSRGMKMEKVTEHLRQSFGKAN